MTDGADYPGYSEPKPEDDENSKIKAVAPFWNGFIRLFDALLAAGKMVTASFLGALMGVQLSQVGSAGSAIEGLMPFYIAFTVVYMVYYLLKKVVESGVLYL